MIEKIKFILISLLFLQSSLSQEIKRVNVSGYILDKKTKKVIEYANISVLNTKIGAASRSDGSFRLRSLNIGDHTLRVSYLGYKTILKKINVGLNGLESIKIYMEKDIHESEAIEVVAKSKSQIIREKPVPITVIDATEFRGRAKGLDEILKKTTGIKIRQDGGLGSKSRISVHGLEGKRVAIFINDFAIETPEGSFNLNDIPIDAIERIEIYKGMVPAHLGGDGLGGAINIVTRENEQNLIDVSFNHGSYNTSNLLWVFKKYFSSEGIQIGFGGFYNYSDNNYSMHLPNRENTIITRNHDKYKSHAIVASLVLDKLWFDEIELEYVNLKNDKEIQGLENDIRYAKSFSNSHIPVIKLAKENFFFENLDFKSTIVFPLIRTQLIDTSSYRWDFDGNSYRPGSGRGEIGATPNKSDNRHSGIDFKTNFNYKINETHSVNLNNQYSNRKLEPNDPLASEHAGYNIGGFPAKAISNVLGLTHEMSLFGGRLKQALAIKSFYLNSEIIKLGESVVLTNPDISKKEQIRYGISEGIGYHLNQETLIKASFERTVRLPDESELFGDGIVIRSSSELEPEESTNINLGINFDQMNIFGLDRFRVETSAFYMHTFNLIKLVQSVNNLSHVNLDEVLIRGVEAEIKLDFMKHFYFFANATYQDLRDARKYTDNSESTLNPTYDLRVPNVPIFFANFGFEFHKEGLIGKDERSRIYFDSSYVDEFLFNWELSKKDNWKIPSSIVHTVGFQQSLFNRSISISAELNNITNTIVYDNYKLQKPGRRFQFKVRYNWFMED